MYQTLSSSLPLRGPRLLRCKVGAGQEVAGGSETCAPASPRAGPHWWPSSLDFLSVILLEERVPLLKSACKLLMIPKILPIFKILQSPGHPAAHNQLQSLLLTIHFFTPHPLGKPSTQQTSLEAYHVSALLLSHKFSHQILIIRRCVRYYYWPILDIKNPRDLEG